MLLTTDGSAVDEAATDSRRAMSGLAVGPGYTVSSVTVADRPRGRRFRRVVTSGTVKPVRACLRAAFNAEVKT